MAYSLTVAGYTFENPPETYRKLARVGNSPQPAVDKESTAFYQSDTQDLQFQVQGTLALDPALGGTDDLDELERLQQIAIDGGEVEVQFDPFFSGTCVIEDNPFRQSEGESDYDFTFTVNEETTDDSAYPAHSTPDTGNTFEFGSLNLGYDPNTVQQNYERQTASVKRLQGIKQSVDNAGLIPKVKLSGIIDGGGQAELWNKARQNVLAYLSAEFQKGWALIDSVSIRSMQDAPDYLTGMFQYDLDVLIVKDPASGIGDVSSYVDQEVKNLGTYTGDADSGDGSFEGLDFTVEGGSGSLDGQYIEWNETTVSLSDNDTNYIYVDDADSDGYGTVKVNQSAFPADGLPLYRVKVSSGLVQKVVDVRAILLKDRNYQEGDSSSSTKSGNVYFTVRAGDYEIVSGTVSEWNDTRLLLASNDRNYIWAEDPEGDGSATVETATSGYPGSGEFVKLWRVDTDADSVTDKIDDRPADLTDSTTDTSSSDLVLSESIPITDQDLLFEHLVRLEDAVNLDDTGLLPALGLATLDPEDFSVADGPFDAHGIASLFDTIAVKDGGSATQGGLPTLTATVTTNGETIDAKVFEDVDGDGTADNTQTITNLADGQNTYNLDGLDGGGTNYWIRFDLSTTDSTVTPEVDKATIDTGTKSSNDSDQNPNTTWEIHGAKHDTSGNEYEGGGVVSRYGAD